MSVSIERSSGSRPEALQGLGKEPGTISATGDASENRQFGDAKARGGEGKNDRSGIRHCGYCRFWKDSSVIPRDEESFRYERRDIHHRFGTFASFHFREIRRFIASSRSLVASIRHFSRVRIGMSLGALQARIFLPVLQAIPYENSIEMNHLRRGETFRDTLSNAPAPSRYQRR